MNAQSPDITLERQIAALDERVTRLLEVLDSLSNENAALKERETLLSAECDILRERNEKATAQLDTLIQHLQNIQRQGQEEEHDYEAD